MTTNELMALAKSQGEALGNAIVADIEASYQRGFEDGRRGAWQPFETAPKDGTRILAATRFLDYPVVELIRWDYGWGGWRGAQGEQRFDAWQPIPLPIEMADAVNGRPEVNPHPSDAVQAPARLSSGGGDAASADEQERS